jgi:ribosomal protein S18 acetylase RimI-like enzyme
MWTPVKDSSVEAGGVDVSRIKAATRVADSSLDGSSVVWLRLSRRRGVEQSTGVGQGVGATLLLDAIKAFLMTTPVLASRDGEEAAKDCLGRRHIEYTPYPSLTESQIVDVVDVYYCAVARDESSPLLVSVLGFARNARPRQTYLQLFLTASRFRKMGVGRSLLYAAVDAEFAVRDTNAIWLHTIQPLSAHTHNTPDMGLDILKINCLVEAVQSLYLRMGFQVRRTLKGYYAHPIDDLLLCMKEAYAREEVPLEDAAALAAGLRGAAVPSSIGSSLARIDGIEMTLTRGDYVKHLPRRRTHTTAPSTIESQ